MVLTSSKKSNFMNKLDFLTKINNFKKYKIRAYLWKIDVDLMKNLSIKIIKKF